MHYPILENVRRFLLGKEAGKPNDARVTHASSGYGGFAGSTLNATARRPSTRRKAPGSWEEPKISNPHPKGVFPVLQIS